jgi:hypothetical protein
MTRVVNLIALALAFALVLTLGTGCGYVSVPTPSGRATAITLFKDVNLGEASYEKSVDGAVKFGLKGYDSAARLEAAEKLLDAAKELVK